MGGGHSGERNCVFYSQTTPGVLVIQYGRLVLPRKATQWMLGRGMTKFPYDGTIR